MKRVENNMTEQQLGLLKAVPLLNGKQEVLRYGSMANVRFSAMPLSTTITYCLLICPLYSWFRQKHPLVCDS